MQEPVFEPGLLTPGLLLSVQTFLSSCPFEPFNNDFCARRNQGNVTGTFRGVSGVNESFQHAVILLPIQPFV